jgi:FAD/FMN-containing dehydrogenase/Fe-S oxidoreductase
MTSLPILSRPLNAPRSDGDVPQTGGPRDLTQSERERLSRDLANAIEGEVRFSLHDRMLYATDASLYQVEPLGVVIPSSVDDALRAAAFCFERGWPILPRGGGTSLAGQCTNRAIVIDLSPSCRRVLEVNTEARTCAVEPGISVDDLNDELAKRGTGLFFAPDPATSRQCNIGGCIGNNAAGSRSIVYGRTSENLVGIDAGLLLEGGVVRATLDRGAATRDPRVRDLTLRLATIVRQHERLIRERFPKTVRRNAGYGLDMILQQMDAAGDRADADAVLENINLAHLLCGSEGTLALTLGARLKLHPVPTKRGLAVIGFASLDQAIALVPAILATKPSAVEMLDDTIIDLARANKEYGAYVELMPAPKEGALRAILYVEYSAFATGDGAIEELRERLALLRPLIPRGASMNEYVDAPSMQRAWKLRKAGEPLLHGMAGERKPLTFVEDNAVPVENLGEFVRRFREIVQARGTNAAFWAHASVGVLHVRPFLSIRDERDRVLLREIAIEVAQLARSLGGVMSGEHGDGKVRGPLLESFYGPELMRAFRMVKHAFDPRNLLNPGNIVAPEAIESITERVRVKPESAFVNVPNVETFYEYGDQHGFAGAVEMCNGAGVCRKRSGGTMCPSYMATLDERHSTRGRGNALRLAITGQIGQDSSHESDRPAIDGPAWSDPATIETLDLCLSCKACKSECPSNVDIARLKAEYTAQRHKASGRTPLKALALGNVRLLNRLGSIAPRLANRINRTTFARKMLGATIGFARHRSVPEFARPLIAQRRRALTNAGSTARASGAKIGVYVDCFTGFNEPEIGLAACRVLEAFGYTPVLLDAGCCGRAAMSMGLLESAIDMADSTLARLKSAIDDRSMSAIVVCEPSCLSAWKDDWLQLKVRTPMDLRKKLAAKSWLVEEFLEKKWDTHPKRPEVSPKDGTLSPVLLHGHCHQKALWGVESSAAFLRRLVGPRLRVLDTGCCGMAGSFGYDEKKYDLSMRIGELSLFPAVREARGIGDACTIIAPGTSCRHQIKDGTRARARHPIEFADQLLNGSPSAE